MRQQLTEGLEACNFSAWLFNLHDSGIYAVINPEIVLICALGRLEFSKFHHL